MPKTFGTEYLLEAMLRFQSTVEVAEGASLCPVVDEVFVGDTDEKKFCVALEYANRLSEDRRFLVRGQLIAISHAVQKHLDANPAEMVLWLRDLDSLTVEAWPKVAYKMEFLSGQGELVELIEVTSDDKDRE
jgi:hypothetical protein